MTELQGQTGWTARRVAIVGAGAMGTSLAAILGRRVPTIVVCRNPERAAELFQHGARTHGAIEASSRPIVVSNIEDLERVGGVSVLFVTTKTTAIAHVAAQLKPRLAALSDQPEGLFVVSYQNGIDPGRQMTELLENRRVVRMVLNFGATMRCGGVEVTLNAPPHQIGAPGNAFARETGMIARLLSEAGLETVASDDIERPVWFKGILNASMNPVAALVNSTVAQVMRSPSRTIVDRLLHEAIAVARAEGLDLGTDVMERAVAMLERAGEHTPSMVEDIRSGRESEVGQLNRQIIEHARRVGVPTPTHEIIDSLIETFDWKIYEGRRGEVA